MPSQCKLLDLTKSAGQWHFRIGHGDNFSDVIDTLKAEVPAGNRNYDPGKNHLWSVDDEYVSVIEDTFPNGKSCVQMVNAQRRLF